MTKPCRTILATLLAVSAAGLPLWAIALGYSLEWNQPTLPVAILVTIVFHLLLIQLAGREDPDLRALLRSGLVYRMTMTAAFIIVLFGFYGRGDAFIYHREGVMHAQQFWDFGEVPSLLRPTGTILVGRLTGVVYTILGSSFAAGMLAYSLAALWGSYFFLRAYRQAFPERELSAVALLLFFLPSTAFWTSAIGKDALTFLSSGLFAYGLSQLGQGFRPRLLVPLVTGLVLASRVRPHIALMLALAATTAIVIGMGLPRLPQRLSRVIGLALLIGGISILVPMVQLFLSLDELSLASTREFLEWQLRATSEGGSAITHSSSLVTRLVMAPLLLIRPFPWEIHNLPAALAAAENAFFIVLLVRYRRRILDGLRAASSNLTLLFALIFAAEFLFAFSSISNIGILVRQRVMLVPFLLPLVLSSAPRSQETPSQPKRVPAPVGRADWRWSVGGRTG